MAETEQEQGSPDPLVADLRVLRKSIKSKFSDDAAVLSHKEFGLLIANEIIPAIIATVDRVIESEELVDEMVDHSESFLHEEDARQIMETIHVGISIISEFSNHLAQSDDVTQKRYAEAIRMYERSAELSLMIVANAAADPDEDSEDSEGDGDEEKTPRQRPYPPAPKEPVPTRDPVEEEADDEAATVATEESDS